MNNRDELQHQARPFGPAPSADQARLFNLTPSEIDGYLPPLETLEERRSRDPRGLGGKRLKLFFDSVFSDDLTLADLYPHRVKAAWRIVREWAVLIGIVERPGESLRSACNVEPSPWTFRKLIFGGRTPPDQTIVRIITDADGLSFLPPAPPKSANGRTDYTPARDYKLKKWCELVEYVGATRLALGTSMEGRYGLAGLTDPNFARLAMPTPPEIYAVEDLFVRETLNILVAQSRQRAAEHLREKYGLFDHELNQILAIAQANAASHGRTDPDAVRGLLMLRLEKILDDCHERFDARGALLTLREMGKLAGLDNEAKDADVQDMANTARLANVARKAEKKLPPPPPV